MLDVAADTPAPRISRVPTQRRDGLAIVSNSSAKRRNAARIAPP